MSKDVAVNFRISEELNEYLLDEADNLSVSKSSLICKIVKEYPGLVEKAKSANSANYLLNQSNELVTSLRTKVAIYDSSKFKEIVDSLIGKEYEGRIIKTEVDVLRLMSESFTFNVLPDERTVDIADSVIDIRESKNGKSVWAYVIGISVLFLSTFFYFLSRRRLAKS